MKKTFNAKKHIKDLQEIGITFFPGAYSKSDCEKYVEKGKGLAEKYAKAGIINLDNDSYNLNNYFRHDHDMLPLVIHPHADQVLKTFLNPDYVMVNSNLINRFRKKSDLSQKEVKHAGHWHSDSRYLGGTRVSKAFTFVGIVMLEAFGSDNGATHYIPGSQKNDGFPERYGNYKYKTIEGDAGTLVLFDSALWHRGGLASDKRSRWSVYSIYGPSFFKPYFWLPGMFSDKFAKTLTSTQRRLFHYDSIPPMNETVWNV